MYDLCQSLHGERKCFTGQQFVMKLTELGCRNDTNQSTATPTNVSIIDYDATYATKLGQYLLSEGIMICQYNSEDGLVTPDGGSTTGSVSVTSIDRLLSMDTSLHGDRVDSPSSDTSSSSYSSPAPDQPPDQSASPIQFKNSPHMYYRFTNIEDASQTAGSFFQRLQILTSSTLKHDNRMNISEFDHARFGTLFLIIDICNNRSKRDRLAKQFLQRNETVRISNQRIGNNINCSKIFRI